MQPTITEILLVDDNPADRELTSEMLTRNANTSRIHAVADGEEAMAFLRREGKFSHASAPDLIVLDLNLPRKDGRAVLAEIKQDPGLWRVPVVIFSTSGAGPDIVASYALGANSYVCKPCNLRDFARAVSAMSAFWSKCQRPARKEKR